MTRTLVKAAAPWLAPIGVNVLDGLDVIPPLPAPVDRLLCSLVAFASLAVLLHARCDQILQRVRAADQALEHGWQLAREQYAEQGAGRHRVAVGETTTTSVPALRPVPSTGTVYTSTAAGRPPEQTRRPAPRHLTSVKDDKPASL